MRQVVQNLRSGELRVAEVPAPRPGPGQVLVANRASLISAGTERGTVTVARKSLPGKALDRPDLVRKVIERARKDGIADTLRMVLTRLDTPSALGYSCAGVALAVGEGVEGIAPGDRVACAGQNYASHAEVVAVPKNLCVRIPDALSFEHASFVTLGAIALQGVRQAEARLGDRVAVIGLGLIGQITVQLLRAAGCRVLGADPVRERRELAVRLGADRAVVSDELEAHALALSEGQGVDSVIITASTRDSGPVALAGAIARKKGRVVVVGAVGMDLPRESYYAKELELRLSTSYGPGRYDRSYEEKGLDYPYGYVRWTERRNMAAFLELAERRAVDLDPLLTHHFDIADAERAYQLMLDGQEPYLGIVLRYPAEPAPARVVRVGSAPSPGPLGVGIIGVGNHFKDQILPRLLGNTGVSLRWVCTATGINARAAAQRFGAEFASTDHQKVLADDRVKVVFIGTRHDSHARLVIDALAAGKHVFVEKPLCLRLEDLEAIARAYMPAAAAGQHLLVGFNRRFSAHAEKAREFLSGRTTPLVMSYRVNAGPIAPTHWIQDPEVGGGRIVGEVCHFIDYLVALSGALPATMYARCIGEHPSGVRQDQSVLQMGFDDGSVGSVVYTAGGDTALAKERLEVFGDGRALVMDDFTHSQMYAGGRARRFKTGKRDKGFDGELGRFLQAVTGGAGVPLPFREIEAVTRASIMAVESMRLGQALSLDGELSVP
jgi:predicted dehydrogenase